MFYLFKDTWRDPGKEKRYYKTMLLDELLRLLEQEKKDKDTDLSKLIDLKAVRSEYERAIKNYNIECVDDENNEDPEELKEAIKWNQEMYL
jgi:hypothetical protein